MRVAHWTELTDDPMDAVVMARRQEVLREAHRPPIDDRIEHLTALARGKRVLDIGVVDHSLHSDRVDRWLHGHLARAAADILGVDVLPEPLEDLRERGYAVECLDVTAGERPAGSFDLIVAGEVIEHLASPGSLFEAARDLLRPGGRFVITAPNPHAVWRVWQHLRDRPHENVDHVTFHTPGGIAELAERVGMRLDAYAGLRTSADGRKGRVVQRLVGSGVVPIAAEAVCESILYEVVRRGPSP